MEKIVRRFNCTLQYRLYDVVYVIILLYSILYWCILQLRKKKNKKTKKTKTNWLITTQFPSVLLRCTTFTWLWPYHEIHDWCHMWRRNYIRVLRGVVMSHVFFMFSFMCLFTLFLFLVTCLSFYWFTIVFITSNNYHLSFLESI